MCGTVWNQSMNSGRMMENMMTTAARKTPEEILKLQRALYDAQALLMAEAEVVITAMSEELAAIREKVDCLENKLYEANEKRPGSSEENPLYVSTQETDK